MVEIADHYITEIGGVYGWVKELIEDDYYLHKGKSPWAMPRNDIPFVIRIILLKTPDEGLDFLSRSHGEEIFFKKYKS